MQVCGGRWSRLKEEFAANGSETDGENLPESRVGENAPQMLKAYICREAYQERLTPDSLYTNLKKLESWVESEKNLVNKAILHSLLAREYSDYMRHNRRQLSDRTALDVDEAPADIREWSTNLLLLR